MTALAVSTPAPDPLPEITIRTLPSTAPRELTNEEWQVLCASARRRAGNPGRDAGFVQDMLDMDFEGDPQFAPQFTATANLPDPEVSARRIAQATIEVLCGWRPVTQLIRHTNATIYTALARHNAMAGRRGAVAGRRPVVRSVRVCLPSDGVAEVAAVVATGDRARAAALRLEGRDGRWVMVALTVA